MRSTKTLIAGFAVVAAVGGPAASAAADQPAPSNEPAPKAQSASAQRRAVHRQHVTRTMRLARTEARLRGKHLRPGYRRAISGWSNPKLIGRQRSLQHSIRDLRSYRVAPAIRAKLSRIAQCESGGNPHAVGGGGRFRGLFQFDYGTWRGVGGKGDPAQASVAEQYFRAAKLYKARGSSPWPVCGSR
jgi:Ni/Co efflux regulator RcnB